MSHEYCTPQQEMLPFDRSSVPVGDAHSAEPPPVEAQWSITDPIRGHAGETLAVLDMPMRNEAWPHLTDGIHVLVCAYQKDKGVLVDCTAERPDWRRAQTRLVRIVATREEAMRIAEAWLPSARAFCAERITPETCKEPHREDVPAVDQYCRECGWESAKYRALWARRGGK